jgi:hypothetical protein
VALRATTLLVPLRAPMEGVLHSRRCMVLVGLLDPPPACKEQPAAVSTTAEAIQRLNP